MLSSIRPLWRPPLPLREKPLLPKGNRGQTRRVLILLGSLRGKAPSLHEKNIPAHRKSSELPPFRARVRMIFAYVGHTFYLPVFGTGKLWQPTIGDDRTHQIVSSAQRGTDDVRTEWEQLLDMGAQAKGSAVCCKAGLVLQDDEAVKMHNFSCGLLWKVPKSKNYGRIKIGSPDYNPFDVIQLR